MTEVVASSMADLRRLQDRLRTISEATRAFAESTSDYEALLDVVAQKLAESLGDACTVFILDDAQRTLVPLALHAVPSSAIELIRAQFASFPMKLDEHPLPRRALETGEAIVIAAVDPAAIRLQTTREYSEFQQALGLHSLLIVPLRMQGRPLGLLALARFRPTSGPFDEANRDLAQNLATHAAIALTNARLLQTAQEELATRQAADRALVATQARLAGISGSSTVGIVLANVHGVLCEANDAFLKMVGYSRDDLRAGVIRGADLTPPEWRIADQRYLHRLLETGATPPWEKELIRKDGKHIPILINVSLLDAPNCVCVITDLTEKKAAETELVRSQARLKALSDAGVIGIVVSTLEGKIIEANDTVLDFLGYPREAILSGAIPWNSLTPPEWHETDARAVQALRDTCIAPLREKELRRADGTRIPVLVGSALLAGPHGELISFILDLTANKQAALAVEHLRETQASEAKFRSLLEGAPDAMVIVDERGHIVLVNGQTERLFGYSRAELLGAKVDLLFPERSRASYADHRGQFLTHSVPAGGSPAHTLNGRRRDGSEFPIEISLSPLTTPSGTLVLNSVRDVTERHRAEERRSRLAALVEASDDAIIGKTIEGVITSWNAGAERIFGFTAEEAVGRPIGMLVPPDREDEERQILARLGRAERMHFDTVRRRKGGREIHVSVTCSPVYGVDGTLVGISKVARDITDQRRAEEVLAKAKDAADTATHELEAFSYSVAHDLRAPLRAMSGFAHLLSASYATQLDAEGKDWLQEIMLNATKMGALIDALLSLARVTRSEPRFESVDLSATAHSVVAQLKAAAPERWVEWVIQPDLKAHLDATLARALFDNLFGNAWKFTSRVEAPRIEFGETQTPAGRAFFVRDNGAGFDMAYAGKLFAPFQRLHSSKEFPGTGIGLATVQRIVRRHGGQVWAEGTVGQGATFYFSFPERTFGAPR